MPRPDDWAPFALVPRGEHAEAPRSLNTPDGVRDRLRAAAFAELQAREAFLWAASAFADDAPADLPAAWRELAAAEDRHLTALLTRLRELGGQPGDRRVSDQLWRSLTSARSAEDFALAMAIAEERGRAAGERFAAALTHRDPDSGHLFARIALEEREHIALARRFYPERFSQAQL